MPGSSVSSAGSRRRFPLVVIYSDPTGDVHQEPCMGLQFEQISSEDRERIRKFIRHEITKGI
jgi:hypothetical protein